MYRIGALPYGHGPLLDVRSGCIESDSDVNDERQTVGLVNIGTTTVRQFNVDKPFALFVRSRPLLFIVKERIY